jgi:Transcriptional regulators
MPQPESKTVTLAQIARQAGVSTAAVSSFLNGRNYGIRVSAGTQARITAACRSLNYQPKNAAARGRIYPHLGDVCFLLNNTTPNGAQNHYFGQMLAGLLGAMKDGAQHVAYVLFDLETDYLASPDSLPLPLRQHTATKFIMASAPNPTLVQYLDRTKLPFVYLGHHFDLPDFCSISPDYFEASRIAVRYLHGLGHRRIAFLTGPLGSRLYNQTEIERGFVQGMADVGLSPAPHQVCPSDLSPAGLAAAVDYCMAQTPRPTALFCFHDSAAIYVSGYLQTRGVRVPNEVSVMGLNDEVAAASSHPAMTTVHFPLVEMGRMALAEVERQALEGPAARCGKVVLPVELVVRASCAAPAA